MAKKKDKTTINLIPREGFTATTSGRILVWALSTFRIVVIVTEIIVMIAFLSRFWLDAQNTDLNDEIRQKRAVLEATQNFQKEFEGAQKLLTVYSNFTKNRGQASDSYTNVTKSLPESENFFLTKLNYNPNSVVVTGLSLDERSIQQFVANLLDKEIFTGVTLSSVETNEELSPYFSFNINAKLN
jgi:Tfp pilus assembly protein PilN